MAGANVSRDLVVSGSSIEEQGVVLSEGSGDPQFLHAVLCQLGLPRNPTPNRTFERSSGRASLSLQAGRTFDGLKWNDQPLPSGTRPRLVLINLCSKATPTRNREVDIGGSVREFLRRLNIDAYGESKVRFRRQMLALSCCHMTLAMATATGAKQVDAKPIDAFQAWHTNEEGQKTLWPGYIRLTDKFFESLMEHAVPLQPEAIGQLQNSAFALDVYSWLAHRLCRVNERNGITLSWRTLKEQFGQEYADTKNFKRKFLGALQKATSAYKEARIESVTGGLKLLPSPPPVKKSSVVISVRDEKDTVVPKSVPKLAAIAGNPVIVQNLISEEALQQVSRIAPGWDKHFLLATYKKWVAGLGEMRRNPDAAFLGWAKKFTKDKRP
jgi:Plasmid encoded RepA protein